MIVELLLIVFFFLFIVNIINWKLSDEHYFFAYYEFISMIILLSIVFYSLNISLVYSIIVVVIADLLIQLFFQINVNSGKSIAKKMGVKKIKKEFFHLISKNVYHFNGFKCHIEDISKVCPVLNYITFKRFLNLKMDDEKIKHQYGKKNVYSFEIFIKEKTSRKFKDVKGTLKDQSIIKEFKDILVSNALVTYYSGFPKTRICIDKDFCEKNPKRVYKMLKSYVIKNQM